MSQVVTPTFMPQPQQVLPPSYGNDKSKWWIAIVVIVVILIAWYAYYPGEVFQLIVPAGFFDANTETDANGLIKGLSASDLNNKVAIILKQYPHLFDSSVRVATEADMLEYLEKGGQSCSGSCFISGTAVRMGYVVQQAAPGSCALTITQKPKLVIDTNIKGWPPFGVSLYGRKPTKLAVESSEVKGAIFPFYRLAANEAGDHDVWSYRDTRFVWFSPTGGVGMGSDWSYFRGITSRTKENVKKIDEALRRV